jgi:hypothetical protein
MDPGLGSPWSFAVGARPRDRVYFHHIVKTAGTALRQVLVDAFGDGNVTNTLRGVKFADAIRDYRQIPVLAGHLLALPGDRVVQDRFNVTLLRDPVERCLSDFFFRRDVEQHGNDRSAAVDGSLEAWLATLSPQDIERQNAHCTALWPFGADAALGGNDRVAAAQRGLETFDFVAVQDEFEDSLILLARTLGRDEPAIRQLNVNGSRPRGSMVDEQVRQQLRRILEPDYEVYGHALRLFGRYRRAALRHSTGPTGSPSQSTNRVDSMRGQPAAAAVDPAAGSAAAPAAPAGSAPAAAEARIGAVTVRGVASGDGASLVGEWTLLDIELLAHQPVDDLTVGFAIRAEAGELVFGTNSRLLGAAVQLRPGRATFRFTFPNELGTGRYTVGVSLHRGLSELDGCFDRRDAATRFEVPAAIGVHFEGRQFLRAEIGHVERGLRGHLKPAALTVRPLAAAERDRLRIVGRRNGALTDHRARLTPLADLSRAARGSDILLPVEVVNLGRETWPAYGTRNVLLSYRWYGRWGRVAVKSGLRSPLPHDVAPGQAVRVECFVRMPDQPGRHVLLLTLVQEEVAWFDRRAAQAKCRLPVDLC